MPLDWTIYPPPPRVLGEPLSSALALGVCPKCGLPLQSAQYCAYCNTYFTTAANDTATPRGWGTNAT